MAKTATTLASELLDGGAGSMEELRIHEFAGDEEAHDDVAFEKLYADFAKDFDQARSELTRTYGEPIRDGKEDDGAVPLNGVFRVAVWNIDGTELYLAAAHEDRGVPILLMLGSDRGNVA